jgi:hypothetical protein
LWYAAHLPRSSKITSSNASRNFGEIERLRHVVEEENAEMIAQNHNRFYHNSAAKIAQPRLHAER